MRVLRAVAVGAVSALLITGSVVAVAPAAVAADPPDPVATLMQKWFTSLGGLAASGPFAAQLSGTTLQVGGADGLDLAGLGAEVASKPWATASSLADVASGLDSVSGGTWSLQTTAHVISGGHGVAVELTASRTVSIGLALNDPAKDFEVSSPNGVKAKLTASFAFTASRDDAQHAWIERSSSSSPQLSVSVDAGIPAGTTVDGALGILGVTIAGDAASMLKATVDVAFADPDGDGRLAYENADGSAGELAAAGAMGGIATASLRAGGSLDGTVTLTGVKSDYIDGLPSGFESLQAAVAVKATDLTSGKVSATFDDDAFDAIEPFQTLETKDLATALAQAASALTTSQRTKDQPLPLMKGSLSDAVDAAESIRAFLTQYVKQPPTGADATDPTKYAQTGAPKFTSLQDLLEKLHAYPSDNPTGASITLEGGKAVYDASGQYPKLRMTLHLANHTTSAIPLDVVGPALTGAGSDVTYGDDFVKDASRHAASPGQADTRFTNDLVGRQVTAGTSVGIVKSVEDGGQTLKLSTAPFEPIAQGSPAPTKLWRGGTPAAKTAYSVSGADPRTGQVELADALKSATGLTKVNAAVPQATITPSYDAVLPIVLDLRPSVDVQNPQPTQNPDGTQTLVLARPTLDERIMIRTADLKLSADLKVKTAVDATAGVGFLQVHAGGNLTLCTDAPGVDADCTGTASDGTRFLSLTGNAPPAGVGDGGDVGLVDFFAQLRATPVSLLSASVHGRVAGGLTFSVPEQESSFFGGGSASAKLRWSNVGTGSPVVDDGPQLWMLKAFDIADVSEAAALNGALLNALQSFDSALHGGAANGVLGTKLPVIGKSVRDLLGANEQGGPAATYATDKLTDGSKAFGDEYVGRRVAIGSASVIVTAVQKPHTLVFAPAFASAPANETPYAIGDGLLAAVDGLTANSAATLNDLVASLNARLAQPVGLTVVKDADGVANLRLVLKVDRSVHVRTPVRFDVPGLGALLGTNGTGMLDLDTGGAVTAALLLPLTKDMIGNPVGALRVDPTASKADLTAELTGSVPDLTANLGALALSLGNPDTPASEAVINAKLGFALTGSGSGPKSLGDFFSSLNVSTSGAGGATCAGISSPDPLALCANLPLYYRALGSDWTALDPIQVKLTKDFDLSNASSGVTLPSLSSLQAAISAQALDLATLGSGLSGYLDLVNRALALAAIAGKLPVVGDDIQQGLDFVNGLKKKITDIMPVDAHGNVDSDGLTAKIKAALGDTATVAPVCSAKLGTVTGATSSATNPVDPDNPLPTQSYTYRVVALNAGQAAPPSGETTPAVTNAKKLDGAHYNTVSWDKSTYATGYRVERKIDNGGWTVVAANEAGLTYKDTESEAARPAAPAPEASEPILKNCPPEGLSGVTVDVTLGSGTISGDGCTGDGCGEVASRPLDLGLPGLSLKTKDQGVSAAVGWGLHLSFGLTKERGFVIYTQAKNSDAGKSLPELTVGATLTAPKEFDARLGFIDVKAASSDDAADHRFSGVFSVDLHRSGGTVCTDAGNCAAVDPGGQNITDFLTPDDFVSTSLDALLTATLNAHIKLAYQLTATASSALPGIRTDFLLEWGAGVVALGDGQDPSSKLSLKFEHVRINPGAFLKSVVGPILEKVNAVYGPIKPIIDTIQAPLPVLSDLSHLVGGGDVSILTLAQAYATVAGGGKTFEEFRAVFTQVTGIINKVNAVAGACAGGGSPGSDPDYCIDIGSFDLDSGFSWSTTATADNVGEALPKNLGSTADLFGAFKSLGVDLKAKPDITDPSKNWKSACGAPAGDRGFTFPVLDNPASLFGMLLGQDIELVCFDSGPLTLGFTMSQSFGPVYAPPPVMIVLSGSAAVSVRIAAGFDTYGLRKAVEDSEAGVLSRIAEVADGLYFKTTDADGAPIPVLQFSGSIAAGAAVSAVIITVGVVGGIALTVGFYWNDPDNDGKFRFREFLATAINNPICLFNVGGELSLFLKVFVTIGYSPFSVSFDFTLVNLKLLDFSLKPDCTPPPPSLGGVAAGTLYLYAGRLGTDALRGAPWGNHNADEEKIVVRQQADGTPETGVTVTVQMLGITEDFPQVKKVVLDGKDYGGSISAMFQGAKEGIAYNLPTTIEGGAQADTFKTGSGPAWINGGGGDDVIVTGDRPLLENARSASLSVMVAGGLGNDSITVGNEDDQVYGDAGIEFARRTGIQADTVCDTKKVTHCNRDVDSIDTGAAITGPVDPEAGSGNDRITVGLGHDKIWGGGGDDVIAVSADSALAKSASVGDKALYTSASVEVHGGEGSDTIATGSGNDTVFTGDTPAIDPNTPDATADRTSTVDVGTTNTVDTGTGSDTVYGAAGADHVTGHSAGTNKDVFFGGPGADILMGGYGADELWGGRDNDYLIAEPSTVDGSMQVVHTPTATASTAEKLLVGGGGSDHIFGSDGPSKIYGDHRDFTCSDGRDAADPASDQPDESGIVTGDPPNDDAADDIVGGAGVDDINAGGGADRVWAKGSGDFVCGSAGNDTIDADTGADRVWAGSGSDTVYGGSGTDHLYGNTGVDVVYGGDDADIIEGNADGDTLLGGAGADTVVGGTRKADAKDATAAAGTLDDTLYGDTGNDLLIGDNGAAAASDDPSGTRVGFIHDLAATCAACGGGDRVFGGDGADAAYGGLGNDIVDGGDGADHVEGNPGADTMSGGAGVDDLIGGSSQAPGDPKAKDAVGYPDAGDMIDGGAADDVIAGDNAIIADTATVAAGDAVMQGRGLTVGRHVILLDLGYAPDASRFGDDTITGGGAADVVYAQGGGDTVHGNAGDDYAEGGQGSDVLFGDAGQDDLVGGSLYAETGGGQATSGQFDAGDVISGGDDADVVLGDNGIVDRTGPTTVTTQGRTNTDASTDSATERRIVPFDLGDAPHAGTSGTDVVHGDGGSDAIYGQGSGDRILGGVDGDYAEGGPGRDWIEGDAGDDDLVGGSSTIVTGTSGDGAQGQPDTGDAVFGGAGDDVVMGDNAIVARVGVPSPLLFRVGSTGHLDTQRSLRLLDLKWGATFLAGPSRPVAGDDELSGGPGVDALLGQDGADLITGSADDDYAEGNGGLDTIYGDRTLAELGHVIAPPASGWPGAASGEADASVPNGQDDLLGGSSIAAFRDANDAVHGDGGADTILGDNGTLARDLVDQDGKAVTSIANAQLADSLTERIYAKRYPAAAPADAAVVRHGAGGTGVEFCTTAQATCEPSGASGADDLWGDAGEDTLYGQDGADHLYGDTGSAAKPIGTVGPTDDGGALPAGARNDDDLYGGLGNDVMFGEAGEDAMLGDRGAIVDTYQDGSKAFPVDFSQVPKIHYDAFVKGTVTRGVDLQHVAVGAAFLGASTSAAIPHRGDLEGGGDTMLGGIGDDAMHGGFGDDLMNGESGGDVVFGDDGADVLWGGKGCDASIDAATPDCLVNGAVDPNARGDHDRMVDYLFGGKGATAGPSVDPKTGALGSDIIDWRPRGSFDNPGTTCTSSLWPVTGGTKQKPTNIDPCSWFVMTGLDDGPDGDNQHHQGIDWMYGGWDRDVLQGDVADNGPNLGDRLLDWNGTYNLYTHCNAAYGGYNDVRQHSPAMQDFLQKWAWSTGAGQSASDATTAGTSAFDELALVYPGGDNSHGSGSAFPSTPGHFDDPNACAP